MKISTNQFEILKTLSYLSHILEYAPKYRIHFQYNPFLFLQMFVVSGGEGFDSGATQVDSEKDEIGDALNYLLFWSA